MYLQHLSSINTSLYRKSSILGYISMQMGQTALHIASLWGSFEAAQALIMSGANANVENSRYKQYPYLPIPRLQSIFTIVSIHPTHACSGVRRLCTLPQMLGQGPSRSASFCSLTGLSRTSWTPPAGCLMRWQIRMMCVSYLEARMEGEII